MGVNIAEIYSPDPFASGGTANAHKRRLAAALLLQKKASEDDKVFSNQHGGMKLATALLGGMMEGWEENKAKRGQAEGYDALLKMYTGGGGLGGSGVSALPSSPSMPSRGSPAGAPSMAGPGMARKMTMPSELDPLFAETEQKYNLPSGTLKQIAQVESSLNPNAKNPNSSASGLFQFINSTARQYGLSDPFDPVASTDAAGRLAADNAKGLRGVLNREPTPGELYLAHQQGLGGASKILSNPNASVASLVGNEAARLNRGAGMTAGDFAKQWTSKFDGAPQQVASADPGFMPGPLSEADAGLPPEVAAATPAPTEQPPAPTWQTAQATPEEFDAQLGMAQGDAASMAPVAPLPPPRPAELDPANERLRWQDGKISYDPPPPPPAPPPATRVPPQAMAQALMAGGGQQIDPNSNNAGAQQFAAAGMGRSGQGMPQAPMQPPPQMAAPQAPSAPPGMYGGGAQPNAQYAQAGPAAQAAPLPQQQQVAQQTAAVAQAGGMTPQQLNEARRTLNNPHVPESVKSSLLQYIQKRFAPPTWKYENVPGYGLVAVNDRDPNQTRDVRRVPESPTVVAEGGTAIDRSGKVIYQGGQKQTDDLREYDTYVKQERAANRQPEDFTPWMRGNKKAGAANNTVTVGGGSDEQIFKQMTESATSARAAVTGLNALREAKKAVDAGIISGAGADLNLGLAKVATYFGADPTRVTNTETFRSVIAPQVAALMKATVGSTQISNADREFAERAAGGSISLDSTSIKRLLGIMERASVISIADHQDRLNTVYPDEGGKFARERAVLGLPGNAPVRVRSPAEAERLPSGTSIILPDGSVGRVP
jgi:hypothetical protein